MRNVYYICFAFAISLQSVYGQTDGVSEARNNELRIQPYKDNPRYWQYKGEPLLLVGASDDDNLFLFPELEKHLDLLVESGGNFVRNTMSSRDEGNEWPYLKDSDGKYDLEQWNPVYWNKFEDMLRWAQDRDIIVQIELWDRFDHSRETWLISPFNPVNNRNYTPEETGLAETYPLHPSANVQPFFHTVAGTPGYKEKYALIRKYQERFVEKLLSHSLKYGNVLYCMNNETSSHFGWGLYWMNFIRERAGNRKVYVTDMFDGFYRPNTCSDCMRTIRAADVYDFVEISQVNSRNFGDPHWDTLTAILRARDRYALRPANCTKVYGGGESAWGSGTNEDGVERFFRNILAGTAAVRHHRPPSGNGLNEKARSSILAVREVESLVRFWNLRPAMELLSDREPNEAYVTARKGEAYVVYFPGGGDITLDLESHKNRFQGAWISVASGRTLKNEWIKGGRGARIKTPDATGWLLVLKSRNAE